MAYPYQSLNLPFESRILTLEPGDAEAPLIGSLSHFSLDNPEPYNALSYSWSRSFNVTKTIPLDSTMTIGLAGGPDVPKGASLTVEEMLKHEYYGQYFFHMGGVLPSGEITLDGVTVKISGELIRALLTMRFHLCKENPLRIWVDALCINQNDIPERNSHVRQMGQIYQKAEHVRVWLGSGSDSLDTYITTMHDIVEFSNEGIPTDREYTRYEVQQFFDKHPKCKSLDWDSIAEFLNRAWFNRTWVVQEAAFARNLTLYVGGYTFKWNWLLDVINFLRSYRLETPIGDHPGLKAAGIIDSLRIAVATNDHHLVDWDLFTLLEEVRGLDSTLPADKIYGVLSLTDQRDAIKVDYSTTAEEAFTSLAISHLNTNSLSILSHCVLTSPHGPQTLDLPSWVPDWTRPGHTEPYRVRALSSNVCGSSKPSFSISPDRKTLTIKGRMLDRVTVLDTVKQIPLPNAIYDKGQDRYEDKSVTPEQRNEALDKAYWDNLKAHVLNLEKIVMEADGCIHTLTRVMMCSRTRDNKTPHWACSDGLMTTLMVWKGEAKSSDEVIASKVRYMIKERGEPVERWDELWKEFEEGLEQFSGAFSRWAHNRRFFKSECGRFGWGVEGIREGDYVVMFYGAEYLFVLREVEVGVFRIVGDAFLDGFSEGGAMEEAFERHEMDFEIV